MAHTVSDESNSPVSSRQRGELRMAVVVKRTIIRLTIFLAVLLLAAPLVGEAQQSRKVPRIGFISTTSPGTSPANEAFVQGLRDLGFIVGQNVSIEYRSLGDPLSPTPEVVADFVHDNVDVIVAHGSPAVFSAKEATKSIPIVMVGARDPVEQQMIASLARPGGNITGISANTGPALPANVLPSSRKPCRERRGSVIFGARSFQVRNRTWTRCCAPRVNSG